MIEATQHIAFQEPGLARREETAREGRFAALVERQSRFVYQVAYAVVRSPHDSEDVVQETFLKLYRTGAWEGMRDEKAFLARTAWRIAVDRLPKARNQSFSQSLSPDLQSHDSQNPEEAVVSADWSAAVHRLVGALPEELRQPLALAAVEELSSREIAQVMGIAEGTVRTRIMRARQILKQKLAVFLAG
jgi:RNA polymerase sigma-70 factor, ECF subfamily